MSIGVLLVLAVALIAWAERKNECDDCGEQLKWCDPARSDVPLTRCFTCEGPHRAYVRREYHDQFDFGSAP